MRHYDALPKALRQWMAGACLPWSATSCLKIWRKAEAEGASVEQRLERLSHVEQCTLKQERIVPETSIPCA